MPAASSRSAHRAPFSKKKKLSQTPLAAGGPVIREREVLEEAIGRLRD